MVGIVVHPTDYILLGETYGLLDLPKKQIPV